MSALVKSTVQILLGLTAWEVGTSAASAQLLVAPDPRAIELKRQTLPPMHPWQEFPSLESQPVLPLLRERLLPAPEVLPTIPWTQLRLHRDDLAPKWDYHPIIPDHGNILDDLRRMPLLGDAFGHQSERQDRPTAPPAQSKLLPALPRPIVAKEPHVSGIKEGVIPNPRKRLGW